MALNTGASHFRRDGGFTLLETILSITLLVVLMAVTVVAVGSFQTGRQLDTATAMFDQLVRTLRIEAADRGSMMRLDLDPEGQVTAYWQPRPFESPDDFQPYTDGPVRRILSELRENVGEILVSDTDSLTLKFYPDGSCDTATIELLSSDPDDMRVATIEIDGVFGRVTSGITSADEQSESR